MYEEEDLLDDLCNLPKLQCNLYNVDVVLYVLPFYTNKFPEEGILEQIPDIVLNYLFYQGKTEKDIRKAVDWVKVAIDFCHRDLDLGSNTVYYAAMTMKYMLQNITHRYGNYSSTCFYACRVTNDDMSPFETLFRQTQYEVPFEEHYKTPDTQGLAQEIFNNKDFSLMPVLADALLDLDCPEDQANLVRNGKGFSNWALFHLRNTESGVT